MLLTSLVLMKSLNGQAMSKDSVSTKATDDYRLVVPYMRSLAADASELVKQPSSWEGKDWAKLGVYVTTATSIYLFLDQEMYDWIQEKRNNTSEYISKRAEIIGQGALSGSIFTGFLLYGYIADKPKARYTSLLAIEAIIFSSATVTLVKYTAGRARPRVTGDHNQWFGPNWFDTRYNSFFSGHSVTAFTIASVIAHSYKEKKWLGASCYSLAGLTAMSRMHDNAHWMSDVFVGSLVGYYFGKFIANQHPYSKEKIFLVPNFNGLFLSYKF